MQQQHLKLSLTVPTEGSSERWASQRTNQALYGLNSGTQPSSNDPLLLFLHEQDLNSLGQPHRLQNGKTQFMKGPAEEKTGREGDEELTEMLSYMPR